MQNTKKVYQLKVPKETPADRNETCVPIKLVYRTIFGRAYSTAFTELVEKHYTHN